MEMCVLVWKRGEVSFILFSQLSTVVTRASPWSTAAQYSSKDGTS